MLPRKSSVLRYLVFFVACVTALLLWLSSGRPSWSGYHTAWQDAAPELSLANETYLREAITLQLTELQNLGVRDRLAPPPVNVSLDELRQRLVDARLATPINPHPFRYVINPTGACVDLDVFVLVYVHSAPAHYRQRMAIRETWGDPRHHATPSGSPPGSRIIKVVFLLGVVPDAPQVQDALLLEADTYGDVVQEDFVDSYRNLTYKGIMGLKWASAYCAHAHYLLKTDDDIFVNMFNLMAELRGREERNHNSMVRSLLLCLVWTRMRAVREPKSKWYLSRAEYPDEYFPMYCSGSAFVLTPDVAAAMYTASLRTPFFWVDDLYVTGLLARDIDVKPQRYNDAYVLGPGVFLARFTEGTTWRALVFGHVHSLTNMRAVWGNVLRERGGAGGTLGGGGGKE